MKTIPEIKSIIVSMVGTTTRRRNDFQGKGMCGEIIAE